MVNRPLNIKMISRQKHKLRGLSKIVWHAAYGAAVLLPARNQRTKETRARQFAKKVQENTDRHCPMALAIAINCILIAIGGMVTVKTVQRDNSNAITATFSDGFLSKGTPAPPSGGNEASAQTSLNTAANQMLASAPAMQPDISVVTTANVNTTMKFEAKPMTSTVQGLSKEMAMKAYTTGSGTGVGTGEGTGTETGAGTGNGEYDGSGKTVGSLFIKGKTIGVYLDTSASMDRNSKETEEVFSRKFAKNAQIKRGDGCSINHILNDARQMRINNIDTICLVVDLEDGQVKEEINELRKILITPNKTIHLYVISFSKPAEYNLIQLIADTGGAYELNGKIIDMDPIIVKGKALAKIEEERSIKANDFVFEHSNEVIRFIKLNSVNSAAKHYRVSPDIIEQIKDNWEKVNHETIKN